MLRNDLENGNERMRQIYEPQGMGAGEEEVQAKSDSPNVKPTYEIISILYS